MKKLLPLLVSVFVFQLAFAENNPTVKEQMIGLNRYWLFNAVDDAVLDKRIPLEDDVPLIQMHLTLVEKHLRSKNTDHLSAPQKVKRAWCLDILNAYKQKGVFPKNLYHKTSTPYFIDDFGTACAVGQLIISTGYEAVAKQINAENNYAYISELNTLYPQLKVWANEFGFEMDELAWIQPGYGPSCDTACNRSLSVWAEGGTEPYHYYWDTNPPQDTDNPANLCPGQTYTLVITDANGDTITNYSATSVSTMATFVGNKITIEAAYELIIEKSSTPDHGNCEGTATVVPSGGSWGYGFSWNTTPPQYNGTATGLCHGTYQVLITTGTCDRIETVIVPLSTSISEEAQSVLSLFPNPSSSVLTITLPANAGKLKEYRILDITGQLVFSSPGKTTLDISTLSKGIYYVSAETETGIYRKSFLKE